MSTVVTNVLESLDNPTNVVTVDQLVQTRMDVYIHLKRLAAEAGFNLVAGSFEQGGTVTSATDALWCETTGQMLMWAGSYSKVVAAGSTITSAGGIGAGLWLDVTNVSLRSELTSGTMTVRNNKLSLRDFVSVKDYGAKGDGVTDDTIAIQNAINYVESYGGTLYFPSGVYRVTSTISITSGLSIIGDHPVPWNPYAGISGLRGTFIYFNHTGKGIQIYATREVLFLNLGTVRDQPAPSATVPTAWTPSANDFDFCCVGSIDVTFQSVTLLNPTNGIFAGSAGGRYNFNDIKMQAFNIGIQIDEVYDVCRFNGVHMWPFWQDNYNVHTYCINNLIGINLGRCDNPLMSNIFTIFAKVGINFYQMSAGGVSKFHLSNCDFDRGMYGLYVNSTCTNGVTGQVSNYTSQGETGINSSTAIMILGNYSNITFSNFRSDETGQYAINVQGTSNYLVFSNIIVSNWDKSVGNYPAINAATSNIIGVTGKPRGATNTGTGPLFGTTGTIDADYWRAFTPVVSSQTGTITTIGAVSGLYKVVSGNVFVKFSIAITTAGTAGGDIRFNLPYGIQSVTTAEVSGTGREIALTGSLLSITTYQLQAMVLTYNNAYPGTSGSTLIGTFSYRVTY